MSLTETMDDSHIFVCRVDEPEGVKDYVTLLPPEVFFPRDLFPEMVIGILARPLEEHERITPDVFARNRVFVDFMHDVIARHGANEPGLREQAHRVGDGFVDIIDQRTPDPRGSVPAHDVVGSFEVRNGEVLPGSYSRNHNHVILSADGFFNLGANLDRRLREEVLACYSH